LEKVQEMRECPLLDRWLKQCEAARALHVTPRTIKRWLAQPDRREKLGAERHGKRWRIPRPASVTAWAVEVEYALFGFGRFDRALGRIARQSGRLWQKWVARVLLGAMAEAAAGTRRKTWSKEGQGALVMLFNHCQAATNEDQARASLPKRLKRWWPKQLSPTFTTSSWELERRKSDFIAALGRWRRTSDSPPYAKDLLPLVHRDWIDQINDWGRKAERGELPKGSRDFRRKRRLMALRTFRARYPMRASPWAELRANVFGIEIAPPLMVSQDDTGPIGRRSGRLMPRRSQAGE
jgi:hypothetical protein